MTYTNVKKILADHDPEVMAEYEPLVPMFEKDGRTGSNSSQKAYEAWFHRL